MDTPNPVGRPTLYRPEYCQELISHMQSGFTFESFAGRIGVAKHTIYDWDKVHPEFLQAKKQGQAALEYYLEGVGRKVGRG